MTKSLITNLGADGDSPTVGVPSPPAFVAPVPQMAPGRNLAVLAALQHRTINDAASAVVPKVTGRSNNAAAQSYEGAAKPASEISFASEILPLVTIATYASASKQVLQDVGALTQFIGAWLTYFVLQKLENLVIAGTGDGTDQITGLIHQGIAWNSTADHGADRILDAALVGLPSVGYSCGLVVMNPTDLRYVLTERTTIGGYVGGGFSNPVNRMLWDFPVVTSIGVPQSTALVIDPASVQILDRAEAQVFIGWVGSQFVENQATILAELRANVALMDPAACLVVALPTNSPAEG